MIGKRTRALPALLVVLVLTATGCGGIAQDAASDPTPVPTVVALQAVEPTTVAPEPSATAGPRRTPTAEAASPTERPTPPVDDDVDEAVVVLKGEGERREIALTFDGGADRGNAELILGFLAERRIVASFGITGQWAKDNPDLVRRMVDEGHMVFSHAWSHLSWTGRSTSADPDDPSVWEPLSRAERLDELERTEEIIAGLTGGYDVRPYFRPPYGDYDAGVLEDLADGGYTVMVMWSCESYAWKGWTAGQIVAYCTTDMADGDIILLHLGADGADYEALPGLVDGLEAQGFAFVTVEEIL